MLQNTGILPTDKKQWKVFFVCVSIASVFWALMTLTETYQNEITFKISYADFNSGKQIINKPPKEITLKVEASGFDLISSQIGFRSNNILLYPEDFKNFERKSKTIWYWLPKDHENIFKNEIGESHKIISYGVDSIQIIDDKISTKKVKLFPIVNVKYDSSLYIASTPLLSPDSLSLTGAESLLKKMRSYKVKISDVTLDAQNYYKEIPIALPAGIQTTQPDKVTLFIGIEPIKQFSVSVPLQCDNCPESVDLKLFPSSVEVSFLCGTKQFSIINPQSFKITVDYKEVINKNDRLNVKLERAPNFIKELKIFPATLEYINR